MNKNLDSEYNKYILKFKKIFKNNHIHKEKKFLDLFYSINNKLLTDKIITNNWFFQRVYNIDKNKAVELVSNISDANIKIKFIADSFNFIIEIDKNNNFELLQSISIPELREKAISNAFLQFIQIDKNESFKLLESISTFEIRDKTISNAFLQLIEIDKEKSFELLESISSIGIKNRVISKAFIKLVEIDKEKSFELLESSLSQELRDKAISNTFVKLFEIDKAKSFELLDSILSQKLKDKAIDDFLNQIIENDIKYFFESINSLNQDLKYLLIINFFQKTLLLDRYKAFLLFDKISDRNLKRYMIKNSFHIFFKRKNGYKAFKVLYFRDNKKIIDEFLQTKEIEDLFLTSFRKKNLYVFFYLLKLFSKRITNNIIFDNSDFLIKIYMNDSQLKYKAFDLPQLLTDKKLKDKFILRYFDFYLSINFYKTIKTLNSLRKEEKDNIIINYFYKIFNENLTEAIILLKSIENQKIIDKTINKYFQYILQKDKNVAIELLYFLSDKKLVENIIIEFFPKLQHFTDRLSDILNMLPSSNIKNKLIINSCSKLLDKDIKTILILLSQLDTQNLKDILIQDLTKKLAEKKDIFNIIILINQISSTSIQKQLRNKYRNTVDIQMNEYIKELNTIQYIRQKRIEVNIKEVAHHNLNISKDENNDLNLRETYPETIFSLIIDEQEDKKHKLLISYLIESLNNHTSKNYSKLAYETISQSKLFNYSLYNLEPFISSIYFKDKLKEFKERKETEQSISKMLGKILKNPKTKREEIFMKRFKQLRKIKDLDVVIPYVAKADFDLAQDLIKKRIDRDKFQEIQKIIFLNEHQNRWDRAVMAYNKIDNFYMKVELSKKVLDSFVPDFESSFFIQAMMILDSQNISKTPMELATIAPKEVLKYYGEIEDEVEKAFDEVLEQIKVLQGRAIKAEELNDEEGFEEILEDEKKLKISIRADEKLFELFLEKYNLNNLKFMRLNLLDFEV